MRNYIQCGETLTLAVPYDVSAGDGFLVGSIFAVASTDADYDASENTEGVREGVFSLAKTSAQAWTVGQKIYWNNSTKKCDTDGAVGILVGVAAAVAANPSSTGYVALNGAVPDEATGPQAAVADLAGTLTGTVDGTMVDVAATAGSCAGGSSPTAAQVDTAIATAVATIVTGANVQNKEVLTKLNSLLAKLRLAGIIAT